MSFSMELPWHIWKLDRASSHGSSFRAELPWLEAQCFQPWKLEEEGKKKVTGAPAVCGGDEELGRR